MAETTKKGENKLTKKRHWMFIAYPESAPQDWIEILTKTGLPIAISPLHDKDVNEGAEGGKETKKAHWHVLLSYSGPTSQNVVSRLSTACNGSLPMPVESVKGQFRYHIHLDNPEKAQYDDEDRILLNGFSIQDFCQLTYSEEDRFYSTIEDYIFENDITEYYMLVKCLRADGLNDEAGFLRRHTYHFSALIGSLRNSEKEERFDFIRSFASSSPMRGGGDFAKQNTTVWLDEKTKK